MNNKFTHPERYCWETKNWYSLRIQWSSRGTLDVKKLFSSQDVEKEVSFYKGEKLFRLLSRYGMYVFVVAYGLTDDCARGPRRVSSPTTRSGRSYINSLAPSFQSVRPLTCFHLPQGALRSARSGYKN